MISVVIPVRNHAATVARAVKSVIVQSIRNWEVLVIENGSDNPHEIRDVVEAFQDKRIKFIDVGPVDNGNIARNLGVTNAVGDIIAYLDSDDEWLPDHLEKSLLQLETHDSMAVYGNFYVDNGFNRKATCSKAIRRSELAGDYRIGNGGKAQTSSFVVKKEVVEKIQWDNDLRRGQDIDFFIRVHENFGWRHVNEPTVVVHWGRAVKRNVDISSCLQMFVKHKENLSSVSRVCYLKAIYFEALLYTTPLQTKRSVQKYLLAEESLSWHLKIFAGFSWAAFVVVKMRHSLVRLLNKIAVWKMHDNSDGGIKSQTQQMSDNKLMSG